MTMPVNGDWEALRTLDVLVGDWDEELMKRRDPSFVIFCAFRINGLQGFLSWQNRRVALMTMNGN
jgi:hypothetical protein